MKFPSPVNPTRARVMARIASTASTLKAPRGTYQHFEAQDVKIVHTINTAPMSKDDGESQINLSSRISAE